MSAVAKYDTRAASIGSLLCVGLDSTLERIPTRFQSDPHPQFAFNRWIIDQTHEFAAAYKPNIAFYEARGEAGWHDLALTVEYLQANYPDIFTICDAKRGDMDSTNVGYVSGIFDGFGFDAVTLHPYLGGLALQPFLSRTDKACIILCRTSNPESAELQDLDVGGVPLWQKVAERVRDVWNVNGNCMMVVGATYPDELRRVRELVPDMTFLVPGVGHQGGSVEDAMRAGTDANGRGLIISASRSIIFADDPASEARTLRDSMRAVKA